jgi:hypothetical protein
LVRFAKDGRESEIWLQLWCELSLSNQQRHRRGAVVGETISGMEAFWQLTKTWWGMMSCAIWTFLGLWVLAYSPSSKSQLIAYFSLAIFSLFLAVAQTIYW